MINHCFDLALPLQYAGDRWPARLAHKYLSKKEIDMEQKYEVDVQENEVSEEALVLEEIQVEELAIDGICGVY